MTIQDIIFMSIDTETIRCLCIDLLAQFNLLLPKLINLLRQSQHRSNFIITIRLDELFIPLFNRFYLVRYQPLDDFILIIIGHPWITSKKVIDLLLLLALFLRLNTNRSVFIPTQIFNGRL